VGWSSSSSRRFSIAIIGGGEGAIVVVPLALIVGINGVCELALFAVFLSRLASFFVSSNFGAPLLTKKLAKSANFPGRKNLLRL
jgi:hypothetical protein